MPGVGVVVGGGGREFAFGEVISDSVDRVAFMPGNGGTANAKFIDGAFNVDGDPLTNIQNLDPDLIFIGPEAHLDAGLADKLDDAGYGDRVIGMRSGSTWLEGKKCDASTFAQEQGLLVPPFFNAANYDDAIDEVAGRNIEGLVIKADGLAEGKGVILPETYKEAQYILKGMFSGEFFKGAGKERVQIQDRWHGPEVSAFSISDGKNHYVIPIFSQDHKRIFEGDQGPNSGGVGAYSHYPNLTQRQYDKILESFDRTYAGMRNRGLDSRGIIYASYMLAEEAGSISGFEAGDPALIEYNVRFGDPEAQVVLSLLKRLGIDVYDLFRSAAAGGLNPDKYRLTDEQINSERAITFCLSAMGYPSSEYRKGDLIHGLNEYVRTANAMLHLAGVKYTDGKYFTNGGRVLYSTAFGKDFDEAAANALAQIGPNGVHFDDMQFREDIGHQVRTAA